MSVWPQLTGNSNVFRQSYVSGFLDVSGGTVLRNDVSMNSRLYVIGDASMGGNVFVGQTIYPVGGINQLSTSLPVMGTVPTDATIANRLFVLSDTSLNGRLFVGGDVSMNGTLITPNRAFINQEYLLGNTSNTSYNSKSSNYGGTNNAFFGYNCGTAISTGASNSGFGQNNTLLGLTTGSSNTAVGSGALQAVTTTDNNTAIGNNAGAATTGSNNTFIGATANTTLATASNSTAIGYGASVTASNQVVLGTATESVIIPRNIRYLSSPMVAWSINGGSQSIAHNSDTTINYSVADARNGSYTGITNTSGTFKNDNSYSVTLSISVCLNFANNNLGFRFLGLNLGGVKTYATNVVAPVNGDVTQMCMSCVLVLNSTESFFINAFQNSGSTLTAINSGDKTSRISMLVM